MKTWLSAFLLMISMTVYAQDLTPDQASLFENILQDTRCVTCANQNLSESNVPVAKAMKEVVLAKVLENQSEQEIRDFLIQRYGDYVTYKPRFKPSNWVLWCAPWVILGLGLAILFIKVRRKS